MLWTEPLTRNNDFRRLYSRGRCAVNRFVAVYVMKNRQGRSRLGITASKKLGNAVERNRARRLIRESVRLMEGRVNRGYDIVVVARHAIINSKQPHVEKKLGEALAQLNLMV